MKKSIIFLFLTLFTCVAMARVIDLGLDRDMVYFPSDKNPGSIVIRTDEKRLYYILGDDLAYSFPIAVGKKEKDRFYGAFLITRKVKWPSWRPTSKMLEKEPFLPTVVPGGKRNPLGARALYLGSTAYRIHGTNNPHSIGKAASHGCIRMYNRDIKTLYNIVNLWETVYVE